MFNDLHPIFGENRQFIPGLNVCPTLQTQAERFVPYIDEKERKIQEFQVSTLLKETLPSIINMGYDQKLKKPVTLLHYQHIGDEDAGDLLNEISVLHSLENKHVLEFYGMVRKPDIDRMYLVFETFHCFLSQLLSKEHQELSKPSVIKCVMSQLLMGLKYLHNKEIVHRDITPNNLVIAGKGVLKISNFRSAITIYHPSKTVLTAEFRYQPVNVLLGSESVTTADDMWSVTCIFAEMLLKKRLFQSMEKIELLKEIFLILGYPEESIWPEFVELPDYEYLGIQKSNKFNCLNKYFQDYQCLVLLEKGFIYNPKRRISAEKFLMDRYFIEEPFAIPMKAFGGMFHDEKAYNFPVKYEKNCKV